MFPSENIVYDIRGAHWHLWPVIALFKCLVAKPEYHGGYYMLVLFSSLSLTMLVDIHKLLAFRRGSWNGIHLPQCINLLCQVISQRLGKSVD